MAASAGEDGVEGGDGVGGSGHGDEVEGFEEAGGGGEEGGVECPPRGGDYLAAAAGDGFGGEGEVGDFEFGVADCWWGGWGLVSDIYRKGGREEESGWDGGWLKKIFKKKIHTFFA